MSSFEDKYREILSKLNETTVTEPKVKPSTKPTPTRRPGAPKPGLKPMPRATGDNPYVKAALQARGL